MRVPDKTSILRVAEAERDHAAAFLSLHVRQAHGEPPDVRSWCPLCVTLAEHAVRTRLQVELLTPAEPEMEAMW